MTRSLTSRTLSPKSANSVEMNSLSSIPLEYRIAVLNSQISTGCKLSPTLSSSDPSAIKWSKTVRACRALKEAVLAAVETSLRLGGQLTPSKEQESAVSGERERESEGRGKERFARWDREGWRNEGRRER